MATTLSRRSVLRGMVVAPVAILASPVVFSVERFLSSGSDDRVVTTAEIADAFVKRAYQAGRSNQFIVRAENLVGYSRMIGSIYSVDSLFNQIGYNPNYYSRVTYQDARGCRDNFVAVENAMRSQNMDLFAGVRRSPFDSDVAMLASKSAIWKTAQSTTQHRGEQAITLHGNEPDVARIAADFIAANYPSTGDERARSVAYVKKENHHSQGVPVTTLTNANGAVILYCSQPSGRATAGKAGVYVPRRTDSRNIPVIGLISSRDI